MTPPLFNLLINFIWLIFVYPIVIYTEKQAHNIAFGRDYKTAWSVVRPKAPSKALLPTHDDPRRQSALLIERLKSYPTLLNNYVSASATILQLVISF